MLVAQCTLAGTVYCKCANAMHSELKYMCVAVFGSYTTKHYVIHSINLNVNCIRIPQEGASRILPMKKNVENELDFVTTQIIIITGNDISVNCKCWQNECSTTACSTLISLVVQPKSFHVSIKVDNFLSIWVEIWFWIPTMHKWNRIQCNTHTITQVQFNFLCSAWSEQTFSICFRNHI